MRCQAVIGIKGMTAKHLLMLIQHFQAIECFTTTIKLCEFSGESKLCLGLPDIFFSLTENGDHERINSYGNNCKCFPKARSNFTNKSTLITNLDWLVMGRRCCHSDRTRSGTQAT